MDNNQQNLLMKKDEINPNDSPFFYWGYISFFTGFLQLTIIPVFTRIMLVFPTTQYFIYPGAILIILGSILWCFSQDTRVYQYDIISKSIIAYGFIQLIFAKSNSNILFYILVIFAGLFYGLGTQDQFIKIGSGKYKKHCFSLSMVLILVAISYLVIFKNPVQLIQLYDLNYFR